MDACNRVIEQPREEIKPVDAKPLYDPASALSLIEQIVIGIPCGQAGCDEPSIEGANVPEKPLRCELAEAFSKRVRAPRIRDSNRGVRRPLSSKQWFKLGRGPRDGFLRNDTDIPF